MMTARFLLHLREWEHHAVNGTDPSHDRVRSAMGFQWPHSSFVDRFSISEFGRDPVVSASKDYAEKIINPLHWEPQEQPR